MNRLAKLFVFSAAIIVSAIFTAPKSADAGYGYGYGYGYRAYPVYSYRTYYSYPTYNYYVPSYNYGGYCY